MQELVRIILSLQLSALIPILTYVYFKPKLNVFFKLLLASILLSIVSDSIGTARYLNSKTTIVGYYIYFLLNTVLVAFLWQKIPFYNSRSKKLVLAIGTLIFFLMLFITLKYNFSSNAFYIVASLNLFLGFVYALYYYYQRIANSIYSPISKDPYFYSASAYLLFCLSTIIILTFQRSFDGTNTVYFTWLLRQLFYLFYNLIISYAVYILYQTQMKPK